MRVPQRTAILLAEGGGGCPSVVGSWGVGGGEALLTVAVLFDVLIFYRALCVAFFCI